VLKIKFLVKNIDFSDPMSPLLGATESTQAPNPHPSYAHDCGSGSTNCQAMRYLRQTTVQSMVPNNLRTLDQRSFGILRDEEW